METYAIVDENNVITNIIKASPAFAASIQAKPLADNALCIGDVYEATPTAARLAETQYREYQDLAVAYIRQLYSQNQENKMLREYLANPEDPAASQQFLVYNADVEDCKQRAWQDTYIVTEEEAEQAVDTTV